MNGVVGKYGITLDAMTCGTKEAKAKNGEKNKKKRMTFPPVCSKIDINIRGIDRK